MYRICVLTFMVVLLLSSCSKFTANEIMIIPQPQIIEPGNSVFVLDNEVQLVFDDDLQLEQQANYFSELLATTLDMDVSVSTEDRNEDKRKIFLKLNIIADTLGDEGYKLQIKHSNIEISANTAKGTFYGLQSLYQILLSGNEIV